MTIATDVLTGFQGNLIEPYGAAFTHVAHLFARVDANGAGSIGRLLQTLLGQERLTWGYWESKPRRTLNVGLSAGALELLRPELASELAQHFEAFSSGMSARSDLLGDSDELDPSWAERHLWLTIHAINPRELDDAVDELRSLVTPTMLVEDARGAAWVVNDQRREHFGFRDDISYPVVDGRVSPSSVELEGRGKLVNDTWEPIPLGEFVFGYQNDSGNNVIAELSEDAQRLLQGGSFAVLRKLKQDVVGFRRYIDSIRGKVRDGDPAAKLVGRERSGEPLVPLTASGQGHDPLSNFSFDSDEFGARCPLGAHVRRANHRTKADGGRHRLMRRGINYGAPLAEGASDDVERGLWFLAFNASIEDQFEFIQRRWLNDPVGNLSGAQDPLAGTAAKRAMAIEGDSAEGRLPVLLRGIPQFVTCLGGQYYLYPGRAGLELLATDQAQPPSGRRRTEAS